MAEQLVTPRENGVPYVILPSCELPPIQPVGSNIERVADWHHAEHPRVAPYVTGSIGAMTVRASREQWVLYNDHHDRDSEGYHEFYAGPEPVFAAEDQFRTVVMNSSLYIPSMGIDVSGKKPREVVVSDEVRRYLLENGHLRVGSPPLVRKYLQEYAIAQGFEHIAEGTIDKFLHAPTQERREQLAHFIIAQLAEIAVDPVREQYCRARRQGLITPAFPARPEHFVKRRVIPRQQHMNRLINTLQQRAAVHYRILNPRPVFEYVEEPTN